MIDWTDILYGAALSAMLAAIVTALVANERRGFLALMAGIAALVGPFLWNSILRANHASEFFHDASLKAFSVSWADTGSGVFTLALAALLFGFGPLAFDPARRAVGFALVAGISAFVVDVYLY